MKTNKDYVVDVLSNYGAMTSKQIAVQVNVKHGVTITASQVAGVLRPLIAKGDIASSKDQRNQTRYWIVKRSGINGFMRDVRTNLAR